MKLPTDPGWSDGLPRIRSRRSLPNESEVMDYAIEVPGGHAVALVGSEEMAKELVQWLGRAYADRAAVMFRALDDAVDPEAPGPRELPPKLQAR